MLNKHRKHRLAPIIALFSLSLLLGTAYGTTITVDAMDDAGLLPGPDVYLRFVDASTSDLLNEVTSATLPSWTSAQQALDYASSYNNWNTSWLLSSAGDIWSSDTIVGESLTGLAAGTYTVSPLSGAFTYDSWNWSPDYGKYLWYLNIRVLDNSGNFVSDYQLGSPVTYPSALEALQASLTSYLNISVPDGGSLNFWIWDVNSIDNAGSLTVDVSVIPEPSTLILLSIGLPFLLTGMWRRGSKVVARSKGIA
jgi:hypothetical protein